MSSTSSIHNKTIRPGSLRGYSYYYSGQNSSSPAHKQTKPVKKMPASKSSGAIRKFAIAGFVVAALIVVPLIKGGSTETPKKPVRAAAAGIAPASLQANRCANNTLDKFILIDVSDRHLWACEGSKTVFDAPVITGMLANAETTTPPGTYYVYAKQTNTMLTGKDSAGEWKRPVNYWMPFLDNEYGTYGFHDATWRTDNEFGNVDPASPGASHGCIELTLASQKWLYEWAPLKTTLTVES